MYKKKFELTIEAGKTEKHYWFDLFRYRELFYTLAWRDIAVRYKQTIIGILWVILQPLLTMVILTLVFGKIARLPSENVPYPIFVFSALLPWTFFATAFFNASNSLVASSNLISKIYFPRLIVPIATIMVSVVDFMFSFIILLIIMFWYRFYPDLYMLTLVFFLLLDFFAALGIGLFVASLNVKYRDFKFVIPFVVQLGLYVSPVAYSTTIVPEKYRIFYYLNPMVAIIDGFRWAISGGKTAFNLTELIFSIFVISIICIFGIIYFRKTEKTFADII